MLVAMGSFVFGGSLYDLFVHNHPLSGAAALLGFVLVLFGLQSTR